MSNNLAVNVPVLKAAVAFSGRQPDAAEVPKIKAAVQLHYGSLDEGVTKGIAAYEEALKKAGITLNCIGMREATAAFHNDTHLPVIMKRRAKLAWQRTIDFFGKHL